MELEDPFEEAEVPEILHSVYAGGPFGKCVDCGAELLDAGLPYAVEKAVRQGEVVFEYALCATCTQVLVRQFSEESMANIQTYLEEQALEFQLGGETDRCHRCGNSEAGFVEEHTVSGLLIGRRLLMGPTLVCSSCLEGIDDVLSQKTRDVHGDFINDNFPGVPEGMDIPVSILGS